MKKWGSVFAVGCALAGSFGCASESGNVSTEGVSAESMPATLVDEGGKVWEKVRVVKYSDAKIEDFRRPTDRVSKDLNTLSTEELAKRIRPVMETNGVEYRLTEADTLKLAKEITDSRGKELSDDGQGLGKIEGLEGRVKGIYNGESRTQIFDGGYPWRATGWMSGPAGSCTVFRMINNYTAITAAHCVKDGNGNWRTRGSLTFGAGTNAPWTTLAANCYDRTTISGFEEGDSSDDYAILRLRSSTAGCNPAGYDGTGWFGYETVGGCTTGIHLNTAGYPGKNPQWGAPPPGNWTAPGLFHDYRENAYTSCITYPSALWFYNDFSPGMSGGPAWAYYSSTGVSRIRGITNSAWTGVFDDSNRARKMDSDLISWFNSNKGY